jgi:hypothetical protein
MTHSTTRLAFAMAAVILAAPAAVFAQDKDPMTVTCAEMMAMDAAAQQAFLKRLVAASAGAADSADGNSLNDLVANNASIGRLTEICQGSPDMMVMDAVRSMKG